MAKRTMGIRCVVLSMSVWLLTACASDVADVDGTERGDDASEFGGDTDTGDDGDTESEGDTGTEGDTESGWDTESGGDTGTEGDTESGGDTDTGTDLCGDVVCGPTAACRPDDGQCACLDVTLSYRGGECVPMATSSYYIGLVVGYGDGSGDVACVGFDDPDEISMVAALERHGRDLDVSHSDAGTTVCRIDGVGCDADDCWCACPGGDSCEYWNSEQSSGTGRWDNLGQAYAGGGDTILRHGQLGGFFWGEFGAYQQAFPQYPDAVTFNNVCRFACDTHVDCPADDVCDSETGMCRNPAPQLRQLSDLPAVQTAFHCALGRDDLTGEARLSYHFLDADYRQALLDSDFIVNLGGFYDGENVLAIYGISDDTHVDSIHWGPYQGRTTPQYYLFSELTYHNGNSYLSTFYDEWLASYGATYLSVVINGTVGTNSLEAATSHADGSGDGALGRAHAIAVTDADILALGAVDIADQDEIRLMRLNKDDVGGDWETMAHWAFDTSDIRDFELLAMPGGILVGAYRDADAVMIHYTSELDAVASQGDFPGEVVCDNSNGFALTQDPTTETLYLVCSQNDDTLTVYLGTANGETLAWEDVSEMAGDGTPKEAVRISAFDDRVSVAYRQGAYLGIVGDVLASSPTTVFVKSGDAFSFVESSEGTLLVTCWDETPLQTYVLDDGYTGELP